MINALINQAVKVVFDVCVMVFILYGIAEICLGPEIYEIIQGVII